jgi:tRNA (guanine-N7-)-methyltransferase
MARGRRLLRLKAPALTPQAQALLADWPAEALWKNPAQFPKLTSAAIFGNPAPMQVEIGCSSGEYLCALAQANPVANFLGIEVSKRAAAFAASLAADLGLPNVRILRANFKFLAPLLVPGSWQRVYLHFPDPVHKLKDEKRRIFDKDFLDLMAPVLEPSGEISVVSDRPAYLKEMAALAANDARFTRNSEDFLPFEPPVKSRFQAFWERKGVLPQRFILRKV